MKNETPNNEMLLFETGTPIASQENKSRKLFDEEFSGKELDMPIDSSTVEIKRLLNPNLSQSHQLQGIWCLEPLHIHGIHV